jgi:hypothetical protein
MAHERETVRRERGAIGSEKQCRYAVYGCGRFRTHYQGRVNNIRVFGAVAKVARMLMEHRVLRSSDYDPSGS